MFFQSRPTKVSADLHQETKTKARSSCCVIHQISTDHTGILPDTHSRHEQVHRSVVVFFAQLLLHLTLWDTTTVVRRMCMIKDMVLRTTESFCFWSPVSQAASRALSIHTGFPDSDLGNGRHDHPCQAGKQGA